MGTGRRLRCCAARPAPAATVAPAASPPGAAGTSVPAAAGTSVPGAQARRSRVQRARPSRVRQVRRSRVRQVRRSRVRQARRSRVRQVRRSRAQRARPSRVQRADGVPHLRGRRAESVEAVYSRSPPHVRVAWRTNEREKLVQRWRRKAPFDKPSAVAMRWRWPPGVDARRNPSTKSLIQRPMSLENGIDRQILDSKDGSQLKELRVSERFPNGSRSTANYANRTPGTTRMGAVAQLTWPPPSAPATLNKHSIDRRSCPILADPRNAKRPRFPDENVALRSGA